MGKYSIRYFYTAEVEELVYKAIEGFLTGISLTYYNFFRFVLKTLLSLSVSTLIIQLLSYIGKKAGEDLFDNIDTTRLNAHLKDLMPGLTAKVFRTYNASITLDGIVS